jgi:hypothetical protein
MPDPIVRPSPQYIRIDPMAETALSGLGNRDITRYLELTKLVIQRYLEECWRPDGQFRQFFDRHASFMGGFIVNEALDQDPDKRHIQIARYFDDAQEAPSQIFIQTSGHEYQPSGLGCLSDGWNLRDQYGTQVIQITDIVKIPVQITCAALKQTDIDMLAASMLAMFGQFQRLTCNYILRAQPTPEYQPQWEVRLPLRPRISNLRHDKLHDDPMAQMWSVQCDLDCVLENSVLMQYRAAPRFDFAEPTFTLTVPSTLRLRQDLTVPLDHYPPRSVFYSTDPRVATVYQQHNSIVIQPRRLGTFTLMVTAEDTAGPETPATPGGAPTLGPRVLFQQVITVVAR